LPIHDNPPRAASQHVPAPICHFVAMSKNNTSKLCGRPELRNAFPPPPPPTITNTANLVNNKMVLCFLNGPPDAIVVENHPPVYSVHPVHPMKFQAPTGTRVGLWVIKVWMFSGAWSLELGIFIYAPLWFRGGFFNCSCRARMLSASSRMLISESCVARNRCTQPPTMPVTPANPSNILLCNNNRLQPELHFASRLKSPLALGSPDLFFNQVSFAIIFAINLFVILSCGSSPCCLAQAINKSKRGVMCLWSVKSIP
jgi:hypothetical protein